MAVKLGRPILVGGIGLSFSLWVLESLHQEVVQLGEYTLLGALALGSGFWLWKQRAAKNATLRLPEKPLERETVVQAISFASAAITQLEAEAQNHPAIATLRQRVASSTAELERQEIRLVVTGGKNVGKTTLMRVLSDSWGTQEQQKLSWSETPALFTATDADGTQTDISDEAIASDLVLFITTGDLTESEFQALKQLAALNQRTILVFNKQDQYLPEERPLVLQQLQKRILEILQPEDVVGIAAAPGMVKVRQHQGDGSVQEWMAQPAPEITQLKQQLSQILVQSKQQLVWASTFRAALALKAEAVKLLNEVRRDRALPIIEQFQWIVAATAFANPVPALDLLATAAINAQLVMDLGAIYQQKFSLQQAQTVAGTMGSLMLKLGLVELSTQTISGMLKSNAITFVAGGIVQGVSGAYLTRLAGLSLIEYFQAQDVAAAGGLLNFDKLGEKLQQVFQQNQRVAFLQSFVKQAVGRLIPESPQLIIGS